MKRYFIYAGSFVLTYALIQVFFGMAHTLFYQPSVNFSSRNEVSLVSPNPASSVIAVFGGFIVMFAVSKLLKR